MDIKDYIPKKGTILVGDGHDVTAKLQHWTNGPGATHGCHITYPTGADRDIPLVMSNEYNGAVHVVWKKFVGDPTYNIWLYEIVGATEEEINHALDYCEREFLNDKYAYLSWPWFGYKALWEKVLNPVLNVLTFGRVHYNIDKQHNWYFKDSFCTEQEYYFLDEVSGWDPSRWGKLRGLLKQYFPDTFQPIQFKATLTGNLDIFRLIAQRVDGVFTIF